MVRINILFSAILLFGVSSPSGAQPVERLTRGQLLYTAHCVSCHTAEIHWREKKLVADLASLRVQVSRWQRAAGLGWSDNDIEQVSAYLDSMYYHFAASGRIGLHQQ